jgi:hypothetical protein
MSKAPERSKITITADQRDALYAAITLHLSAIDGIVLAIANDDLAEADELSRLFMHDLWILRNDLGWGKHGKSVQLTSPPEVLLTVLPLMKERAEEEEREEAEEYAEIEQHIRQNRLVQETCNRVLGALERA